MSFSESKCRSPAPLASPDRSMLYNQGIFRDLGKIIIQVLEVNMSKKKTIVVTVYGHSKTIDKISVTSFRGSKKSTYGAYPLEVQTYCNTINSLELKGDSWVRAKILSENTHYTLNSFFPLDFSDMIMKLDNLAIQKVFREIDSFTLAKSLKDQEEIVKERIFSNMSKRASQMMKEEMEFMGPVMINDIKESQEKILSVIQHLIDLEEINIPYSKGETTV
jgi:flagellar motor switch protein FliG